MNDDGADGWRALAITAYAGSLHGRRLIAAMAVLNALHRPADLDRLAGGESVALRCPTCRDSHGRRAPWPCRTFVEMLRGLGCDPGPAVRQARRRRHVVWGKHAGKCGSVLVAELDDGDDALPVCGLCVKSLARLERERSQARPRVVEGRARW